MKFITGFKCKSALVLMAAMGLCPLQAHAGGATGVGGGGQAVQNKKTGEWLFLDLLTSEQVRELERGGNLKAASQIDLLHGYTHTREAFRELGPYKRFHDGTIQGVQYPQGAKFETSQATARALLQEANKAFPVEYDSAGYLTVDLSRDISHSFRSTLFRLPQTQDAMRVQGKFQITIAHFENGMAYFQQQLMEKLSEEQRAAVFVKETLRFYNNYLNMDLMNMDIEEATYLICTHQQAALSKSTFGLRFLQASQVWAAKRGDLWESPFTHPRGFAEWEVPEFCASQCG